ncbi:FadR/GntR family transcriptional regulator [Streptomonospora nanhaiensis]|uniref:DNA-binding FadR family transcriptional regulator n=1 Tax=Streptomonospora nanhaiensis TaxID=1323731 RepID=A0A853BW93_9ACTN|nr:FCD domain-containing protein [Streptomonospora nanhaiensis]MBV2364688.1 FCD domain-containing protein [Streptomonospora nanhaiensis]MBX9389551.1 FCD domain-containing protein [Streptomonospora nanhaiensis]NYI99250.1 DNA-binding FadR family transcriptional regulator [Streptomonospora nanhaiensis]
MTDHHRTLHNRVLAEVGPAIAAGEYAPGAVLTLDRLAQRFGVSRTVAREAVRVLESMRMVVSRPRTGVRVRPQEEWSVFDPQLIRWRLAGPHRIAQLRSLTELRAAVEPPAAAFAARRAAREERERIVELNARMVATGRSGDLEAFLHLDIEFHRRILELSRNEMFAGLSGVVAEVLTGRTEYDLMPNLPRPEALRLHTHVAEAIGGGLADVAEAAMRAIVDEVVTALDAAEEPAAPSAAGSPAEGPGATARG